MERKEPIHKDGGSCYFRDQTSIIHSLPFRRLKHKTQVFFAPDNDHVCTRIEHALHVATIAANICRELSLNDDLAYAIGLAHDVGHAPFGHAGENALNEILNDKNASKKFIHEIHGLRVVDILGNRGKSLNLTYAVRDGVVCHCGEELENELIPRKRTLVLENINQRGEMPYSWEGCVVRLTDRLAYLGRDLEDALLGGYVNEKKVPRDIKNCLGTTNGEIINTLVADVIETSRRRKAISLSRNKFHLLKSLYDWNMEYIYQHPKVKTYRNQGEKIIKYLFDYLLRILDLHNHNYQAYKRGPMSLDKRFGNYLYNMRKIYKRENSVIIVLDYVAGMTDSYLLKCMNEIVFPEPLPFDNPAKLSI